jgi:hypothetical protein
MAATTTVTSPSGSRLARWSRSTWRPAERGARLRAESGRRLSAQLDAYEGLARAPGRQGASQAGWAAVAQPARQTY